MAHSHETPYCVQWTFHIPEDLAYDLEMYCLTNRVKTGATVCDAIRKYIGSETLSDQASILDHDFSGRSPDQRG